MADPSARHPAHVDDGGWFDGAEWAALARRGDRTAARELVAGSLESGGAAALAEIATYYRTLGEDRGSTLLWDLPATADDRDALIAFFQDVYADESRPSDHRGSALQRLTSMRAPGFEDQLVADLTARSEDRRYLALSGLARRGTQACVEPVTERVRVVLRRPAFDLRDNRYRGELLPAFVAVLRCAERQQLVRFAELLRLRQAHLSGVEFSWLRDLWPGALDEPLHAPVPEPVMERVLAWTRGEHEVDLRGWWVHPPEELRVRDPWDVDPPVVDRT